MEFIYIKTPRGPAVCGCKNYDGTWCEAACFTRASSVKRHIQREHMSNQSLLPAELRLVELNTRRSRGVFSPYNRDALRQHLLDEMLAGHILRLPPHLLPDVTTTTSPSAVSPGINSGQQVSTAAYPVGSQASRPPTQSNSNPQSSVDPVSIYTVLNDVQPNRRAFLPSTQNNANRQLPIDPMSISAMLNDIEPSPQAFQPSTQSNANRQSTINSMSISAMLNDVGSTSQAITPNAQASQLTTNLRKRRRDVEAEEITPPPSRRHSIPGMVKLTKTKLGIEQVKGLQWLSAESYVRFDQARAQKLLLWGRSTAAIDSGPCLLLPSDWDGLEVEAIIHLLIKKHKKFPTRDENRLNYGYEDHLTSHSRAQAWYSEWPRCLHELGVLLDCCAPEDRFDGSHLCHRPNCLLHVCFEPWKVNQDRKDCHVRAIQLRRTHLPVPASCDKHDPPCLMQHAALTTIEAYMIQISIFLKASGQPIPALGSRAVWPRSHKFRTFETSLPLAFPTENDLISLDDDKLAVPRINSKTIDVQLGQVCRLCPHVKNLSRFHSFVRHIVRQHTDAQPNQKVQELKRAALYWSKKMMEAGSQGPRLQKTREMVTEALNPDFAWSWVAAWRLGGLNDGEEAENNADERD